MSGFMFKTALGEFAPWRDEHAAIMFVLDAASNQLDKLRHLLRDDERDYDAYGGDPGWTVERRRPGERETGFDRIEPWPDGAEFRAYVDPEGYELAHPSCFMDRATFETWLARAQAVGGR